MTTRAQHNPRVLLEEDHRRIDTLLDHLVAVVRADDPEEGQRVWARVEKALLAHLDVEEMFVFPAIGEGHPEEVKGLRAEHDALRRDLGTIGLSFEIHTVRAEAIERLCASLREHAAREESLAYPEAERRVPVSIAQSIWNRLRSVLAPAGAHVTMPAGGAP